MNKEKIIKIISYIISFAIIITLVLGCIGGIKYLFKDISNEPVTVSAAGLQIGSDTSKPTACISLSDLTISDGVDETYTLCTPLIISYNNNNRTVDFSYYFYNMDIAGSGYPELSLQTITLPLEFYMTQIIDMHAFYQYQVTDNNTVSYFRDWQWYVTCDFNVQIFSGIGNLLYINYHRADEYITFELVFESSEKVNYIFMTPYYAERIGDKFTITSSRTTPVLRYDIYDLSSDAIDNYIQNKLEGGGYDRINNALASASRDGRLAATAEFNNKYQYDNIKFSLNNLISAIFDGNVSFFGSLLSFDFFGYNFTNFYKFLIGLSLITIILRFAVK